MEQQNLFERNLINQMERLVGQPVKITLTANRRSFISAKRIGGIMDLRISRLFSMAPEQVLRGVADFVTARVKRLPGEVRVFMESYPAPEKTVRKVIKKYSGRGRNHNLPQIAETVNHKYFNGAIDVKVVWGEAPAWAKKRARRSTMTLGSYDRDMDIIKIHPALDTHDVPAFFVEMVVYHEMLHKALGVTRTGSGRRAMHTAKFRQMERLFEGYELAFKWEKDNLGKVIVKRNREAGRRG